MNNKFINIYLLKNKLIKLNTEKFSLIKIEFRIKNLINQQYIVIYLFIIVKTKK